MQDRGAGTIPLRIGDPACHPASFTRFVLPFVWTLEPDERADPQSHFYEAAPPPRIVARSRYFTPETADVLFRRARWLELRNPRSSSDKKTEAGHDGTGHDCEESPAELRRFQIRIGDDEIEVALAPPRLVLFEEQDANVRVELTATGFLLVDLYFPIIRRDSDKKPASPPTLDDLLLVNESFRYWRQPFDVHPTRKCTTARGVTQFQTMMAPLNEAMPGFGGEGFDDYLDRWDWLLSFPIKVDGQFMRIASTARKAARKWTRAKNVVKAAGGRRTPGTAGSQDVSTSESDTLDLNALIDDTGWIAYTDERAFVWTCAITDNGAKDLTSDNGRECDPAQIGMWVRLLNVDTPSNNPATPFETEWLRGRTYERWKHFGTLYGFNTHSGAMLASPCDEPPLWRHFSELYFDQVLLLLYLRVSTFRFSRELSRISVDLPFDRKRDFREFRKIRRVFAFLTNLYRFPLLSSQQQGIEMYAYARKWLDVDELFKEVQDEVRETHEMFELATASQMAVATAVLTCAVLIIGAGAGVMAFLAAEDIPPHDNPRVAVLRLLNHLPLLTPAWWLTVGALAASTALAIAVWRWLRK